LSKIGKGIIKGAGSQREAALKEELKATQLTNAVQKIKALGDNAEATEETITNVGNTINALLDASACLSTTALNKHDVEGTVGLVTFAIAKTQALLLHEALAV
jgi:hypothetical protein